jgi:hypothetical protein
MRPNTINAAIIRTNGQVEQKAIPNTLEAAQEAVGGYIEIVAKIGYSDCFAVLVGDEEARLKELPINMPGTLWTGSHGMKSVLHGDLLVVGQAPKSEEFCDCPEAAADQIPRLWQPASFEVIAVSSYEEMLDMLGIPTEEEEE